MEKLIFKMPEEITWRDPEDYIHITDSKGLIKVNHQYHIYLEKELFVSPNYFFYETGTFI